MITRFIRNTRYLFLLILALPLSVIIANCSHQQSSTKTTVTSEQQTLSQILDIYGYQEPQQKQALEYLLQQAAIINPCNTLKTQFPPRKDKQALLSDILELIEQTQKHFTIRTGAQERWEIKAANWMEQHDEKIATSLNHLNVTNDINPTIKHPDAICVLGSTFKNMQARIAYAKKILNNEIQTNQIIMLVGERYASVNIDGTQEELEAIAQECNVDVKKLTETHLGKKAYQLSDMPKDLPLHVIDTPAGNLPRPTTETTVMELVEWLKKHPDVKTVVFISMQPNVKYQEAVINEVLTRAQTTITFEVVGPKPEQTPSVLSLVGAVGSYLWAKTPYVIEQLGLTIEALHQARFKELYAKNPVMSQHINKLCI